MTPLSTTCGIVIGMVGSIVLIATETMVMIVSLSPKQLIIANATLYSVTSILVFAQ